MKRATMAGLSLLVAMLLGACAGGGRGTEGNGIQSVELPPEIVSAPVKVREAYLFALANRELLEQIPCYCGCGAMGHKSNYACYVAEVRADGSVEFDYHAFG